MDLATHPQMWTFAGTLYALAGAALLWLAVYHATSQAGAMRGSAAPGDDARLRHAIDGQRFDARAGATLLVIGFFMQATGAVGTPSLDTPGIFMLLGLAVGLVVYAMSKDLLIDSMEQSAAVMAHKPQLITKPEPIELDDVRAAALRQRS